MNSKKRRRKNTQTPGKCYTDTKWFVVPKKGNEKRTVLVVSTSNPLKT